MRAHWLAGLIVVASGLSACSDDGEGGAGGEAGEGAPVYYGEVEQVLSRNCSGCHTEGGAAPFRLDTFEDAKTMGTIALSAIDGGRMPPWMPDPDCSDIAEARLISGADVETLRAWVEAGSPEGDAADSVPYAPPVVDFVATHSTALDGSYVPTTASADDYRCFILDGIQFPEDAYLTGSRVVPSGPQVHHVLVYAMEPRHIPIIEGADAESEESGYPCFAGPLPTTAEGGSTAATGLPTLIGGWVPGAVPNYAPEGQSTYVAAGSLVVMQIHFSPVGGEPYGDTTALEIQVQAEPTAELRLSRPVAHLDIPIPAGEARSEHVRDYTNWSSEPLTVQGITAHMHLLGIEVHASKIDADGGETCLLSIDDWDYNWQQRYSLEERVVIQPREKVRVTCVYDNSAANQPIVDGEQIAPQDVAWGDGTLDEMCLIYLDTVKPYAPPPAAGSACAGAETCMQDCEAADTATCLLECEQVGIQCMTCLLDETLLCGLAQCVPQLEAAETCITSCAEEAVMLGGATGTCAQARCAQPYQDVTACLGPVWSDAACEDARTACGLELP